VDETYVRVGGTGSICSERSTSTVSSSTSCWQTAGAPARLIASYAKP
jgi:hypothetical protein